MGSKNLSGHRWLRVTVPVSREGAARCEQRLLEAGALSVTLTGTDAGPPLLEPAPGAAPLWRRLCVVGLFDATGDPARARHAVLQRAGLPPGTRTRLVDDRDWAAVWRQQLRPRRFGKRLWVVPRGHAGPAGAACVELEPGLAFGSGAHATTALCLEWLDAHPPEGLEVLDFGCGSGILGIAAAQLGARHVVCVDQDAQARAAADANARRNRCRDRIDLCAPEALPSRVFGLALANILARPLLKLEPVFAARVQPGGALVLSGLLPGQCDAVAAYYLEHFTVEEVVERDGWARLWVIRREPVR